MPIATGLAIGLGAASIGGSIASSAIGAHAAGKAAKAQTDSAMYSADLQKKAADEALAFQKQVYGDQRKDLAPWLTAGQGAIGTLSGMVNKGEFGDFTEKFTAPTNVTEQNDPGYQFRLSEGQKALERSAAARGSVLGGGTAKALERYSQDYASNEYGNVYGRALGEYQQRYNIFKQNQNDRFNRYAALSGIGQTASGQLTSAGSSAAGGVNSILLNSSRSIGDTFENAGAARASGYVGAGNAISSGITGGVNSLTQLLLLSKMGAGGGNVSLAGV